jgi:uncharacterized membrane protein YkvA (DUF1232 family)
MKHVKGFFRMLGALFGGKYRKAPWRTGIMLVMFTVYLLVPLDFILDAIPVLGYVDDAAVFGVLLAAAKRDVDKFLEWEGQEKE